MTATKDYYATLEVTESTGLEDIKKAYRKLALKYHPDRNAGDKGSEARFKEISEAYYVLSDPKRREEYDLARKGTFTGNFHGAEGFDFSEFMNAVRGSNGRNRSPGFGGLEDVLGNLFSKDSGGYSSYDAPEKVNTDIQTNVTIPRSKIGQGIEVKIKAQDGKSLTVRVPTTIKDGQNLRLKERGRTCPCCDKKGDIYVRLNLK
jgi:DnaJ-class molecular chaperone